MAKTATVAFFLIIAAGYVLIRELEARYSGDVNLRILSQHRAFTRASYGRESAPVYPCLHELVTRIETSTALSLVAEGDAVEALVPLEGASLRAALFPLLQYAVDSSPNHAVVTVELRRCPRTGSARVEIRDAGPGLDSETLNRVMAPEDVESPTTPRGHRLRESLQGLRSAGARVEVASVLGRGTRVRVTFEAV